MLNFTIKDTRTHLDLDLRSDRVKSNVLLVEYFFHLVEKIQPQCSFELGAFTADFSRKIKQQLPSTKIYAFEANPHNYQYVLANFELEGITYINKALWNENKTLAFNLQTKINGQNVNKVVGNNSVLERHAINFECEVVDVEGITLSSFINENNLKNKSSVLWIDVEGASKEVLNGCVDVLDDVKLIFIEVEEVRFWKKQWLESDVNAFLKDAGFTLIARDGEYPKQYNQIYIKNSLLGIV